MAGIGTGSAGREKKAHHVHRQAAEFLAQTKGKRSRINCARRYLTPEKILPPSAVLSTLCLPPAQRSPGSAISWVFRNAFYTSTTVLMFMAPAGRCAV
jgi:hypothetical protein